MQKSRLCIHLFFIRNLVDALGSRLAQNLRLFTLELLLREDARIQQFFQIY